MQTINVDAQREATDILRVAARGVKQCLGMMIQRHVRIDNGSEPLDSSEYIGVGAGVSALYEVAFSLGLWARVTCVYETVGSDFTLLAIDAYQGVVRLGLPSNAPDARARGWSRSS